MRRTILKERPGSGGAASAAWRAAAVDAHASGLLATLRAPCPPGGAPAAAGLTLPTDGGPGGAPPLLRDPLSGAVLALRRGGAAPAPPRATRQLQVHSRSFWLVSNIDIAILRLRACPPVCRATNERVCTAGTPTGVDGALRAARPRARGGGARRRGAAGCRAQQGAAAEAAGAL
jgi:hypothetical protein